MRVNKKSIAEFIKYTLKHYMWHDNKEQMINRMLYEFGMIFDIGVSVAEWENKLHYWFMKLPHDEEFSCYGDQLVTCHATDIWIVRQDISNITADDVRKILERVENKLCLPHWEDYLEEKPKDKEPTAKDFVELGKAIGEGMAAGLKHDDQVDALYYGYNTKELQDLGKSVVDKSLAQLKDLGAKAATVHFVTSRGCGKSNWIKQAMEEYAKQDVKVTCDAYKRALNWQYGLASSRMPDIAEVIFNDPATIIIWRDGTKTVVKAQDGEAYDPEKGLAMAICKKVMGNTRDYYNVFLKYLKQWKKENPEKVKHDAKLINEDQVETYASFKEFALISGLHVELIKALNKGNPDTYRFTNPGVPEHGYYDVYELCFTPISQYKRDLDHILMYFNKSE